MAFLAKLDSPFYLATAQSQCIVEIGRNGRNGRLSTLSRSCRFVCWQKVLKTFPSPACLLSEDGIVRQWNFLLNLHIYSSPFYLATAQSQCLMEIERDGSLSTKCHSCVFACQQKMLKTFPGPGYLRSENGVV